MLQLRFGKIVFLVVALAAVGQFANTIYVPAMTMIAASLKINAEHAQWLMTAYLLTLWLHPIYLWSFIRSLWTPPVNIDWAEYLFSRILFNGFCYPFSYTTQRLPYPRLRRWCRRCHGTYRDARLLS